MCPDFKNSKIYCSVNRKSILYTSQQTQHFSTYIIRVIKSNSHYVPFSFALVGMIFQRPVLENPLDKYKKENKQLSLPVGLIHILFH